MQSPARRDLAFASFKETIKDISELAEGGARTTGQHSFAQIVQHLAIANEMVIGNVVPPKLPWYMRLMMPLMRNRIFNSPAKPGFKLPTSQMQSFFWPEGDIGLEEAVANFKKSVANFEKQGPLPVHPIFGKATKEQVHNLLMSHAAMHLSFVHPDEA